MYTRSILLYLGALAWLTQGAPLNINLGAYSPALVVGDGEISFGVSTFLLLSCFSIWHVLEHPEYITLGEVLTSH